MNTALMTFAASAFIALSAPAYERDVDAIKNSNASQVELKSRKAIESIQSNDQVCDTTSNKTPACIDLSLIEDTTY